LELLAWRAKGQKGSSVAHREEPTAEVFLDLGRELEQSNAVGDAAPITADALRQLLLRPSELREQPLIGLGLFHGIQVFAKEVFHQRQFEALGVSRFPDDRWNLCQSSDFGGAPATLTDDELIALSHSPHHHRLKNAGTPKGRREFL